MRDDGALFRGDCLDDEPVIAFGEEECFSHDARCLVDSVVAGVVISGRRYLKV